MKRLDARVLSGLVLILGGLLFLLQTMNIIPSNLGGGWAILFGLAGVAFGYVFLVERQQNWWAIIPGLTLLGLAALIGIGSLVPGTAGELLAGLFMGSVGLSFLIIYLVRREFWWALIPGGVLVGFGLIIALSAFFPDSDELIGALFIGFIGLAFWIVYLAKRDFWWAIIPAGVMTTLAITTALVSYTEDFQVGVMFLGFAATFALVGVVPTREGRMTWAFIPAGIMAVLAVIFLATLGHTLRYLNYVWPVLLLLVGLYLIWQSLRKPAA